MTEKNANKPSPVNRRSFLKRVAAGSALSAGALAVGFSLKGERPALEKNSEARSEEASTGMTRRVPPEPPETSPASLVVARGDDPAAVTRKALEALGGMQSFLAPGERVLLKPNIGWDRRPKFAANTNPDVVAEVVRMCLEAGAKKVLVTDSPCNNPARCFDRSGLKKTLANLEAELLIPTDRDYVEIDLKGELLKTWPVFRALLEYDKVINLPIAKHHSSAILSLGMKNWYGILGGGKKRGQLHQAMAMGIAELADFVRPELTVLDANRILFRNGPQGGSLQDTRELKTVVVSRDPVAVDAYGAGFFDLTPEEVPFIPLAAARGLGSMDLNNLKITEVEA